MTTRILFDLAAGDGRRFSPFCWRSSLSLAHKGLAFEARPLTYGGLRECFGDGQKLPILMDGKQLVRDSFEIALYLDATYPDLPQLFGSEAEIGAARFIEAWAYPIILGILPLIAADIWQALDVADRDHFRRTREARFGASLETLRARRAEQIPRLRGRFDPVREVLSRQPFIGGKLPNFADYIVVGMLQWPETISDLEFLEPEDAINDWYRRCLALHGRRLDNLPMVSAPFARERRTTMRYHQ